MLTCLGTGAVLTETERETDYRILYSIQHNIQLWLLNTSHILQSLSSIAAKLKKVIRQAVLESIGDHANIKVYTQNKPANRKRALTGKQIIKQVCSAPWKMDQGQIYTLWK